LHDDETCIKGGIGGRIWDRKRRYLAFYSSLFYTFFPSFHEITPFMIDSSHIISMMTNRKEKNYDSYLHVYIRHVWEMGASRSRWNEYDNDAATLAVCPEDSCSSSSSPSSSLTNPQETPLNASLRFLTQCVSCFFLVALEPKASLSQFRQIIVFILFGYILPGPPNMTSSLLPLPKRPPLLHSCKERSRWGVWLQLICISLACLWAASTPSGAWR
jgi:hypothetical protein